MTKLTEFSTKVIRSTKQIPKGKIATYKQIAELAGKPHASRGVAWILNSSAKKYKLPWHRVLSSRGRISFKPGSKNYRLQRAKLKAEGVVFQQNDDIDLKRYRWRKKAKKPKPSRLQPTMFA